MTDPIPIFAQGMKSGCKQDRSGLRYEMQLARRGHETVRVVEADGGRATHIPAGMGIESDVKGLIEAANRTFGGVDILINNVSAPCRPGAPIEESLHTIQVDLFEAI